MEFEMARNIRDFRKPDEFVAFITNRVYEGLPFLPVFLMRELIFGIIAKCQEKHPVTICHMLWMSNHFHMIVSGPSCKHISKFYSQMQSEIAKMIKEFTGSYHRGLWEGRYSMQRIGTGEDVIRMIAYLYTNPVKAGLVRTVEEWEGVNTYQMYRSGSNVRDCKNIAIRNFKHIRVDKFYAKEAAQKLYFDNLEGSYHEFRLSPNNWKYCFNEYRDKTDEEIFREVDAEIKALELQYQTEYKNKFMGIAKIKKQSMTVKYTPKAKSPTPMIICSDTKKRIEMIKDYKAFQQKCHDSYKAWKTGLVSQKQYEYGAYRPGLPIVGRIKLVA